MLLRKTINGCTVRAPAKLNLCLEVLGRRSDGYHALRTVMCPLRWFDTVSVNRTDDPETIRFDLSDPHGHAPSGNENLVVAALEQLRDEAGVQQGASVRLVKRIPSRAGLGGGSSDAAAALVAANQAWGLGFDYARLQPIAARLGSDVPFFLQAILARCGMLTPSPSTMPGAALCTSRGEEVQGIASTTGTPCVVVKPAFGLSTPKVFAEARAEDFALNQGNADRLAEALAGNGAQGHAKLESLRRSMGNALQAAAARLEPRINAIVELFDRLPVVAHQLSGSGSAYFAICRSHRHATELASVLRGRGVGQAYAVATC